MQNNFALRSLIEEKEREIHEANERRMEKLESRVIELEEALRSRDSERNRLRSKLDAMESDFSHNLKLLEEREVEIERLEGVVQGLRRAAAEREEAVTSSRKRAQELEKEQLQWKKAERDLEWKLRQVEGRLQEAEAQRDRELRRAKQEFADKQQEAEEQLAHGRDNLIVEKAEICKEYERQLQQALMNEEELRATISRQHLELAEANRKAEELLEGQRELDRQAGEMQDVLNRFDSAVLALQDLEGRHAQLKEEYERVKTSDQNRIQELQRQIEDLKELDMRRVAHFEEKVHELASAQQNVEKAYELSQKESASLEERLQRGLQTAASENKKLKAKLKDSELRITHHLQELDQARLLLRQEREDADSSKAAAEELRRELGDKAQALARLEEKAKYLEERQREAAEEVRRAVDQANAATARAVQAEENLLHMSRKVSDERRRNAALAGNFSMTEFGVGGSPSPGRYTPERSPRTPGAQAVRGWSLRSNGSGYQTERVVAVDDVLSTLAKEREQLHAEFVGDGDHDLASGGMGSPRELARVPEPQAASEGGGGDRPQASAPSPRYRGSREPVDEGGAGSPRGGHPPLGQAPQIPPEPLRKPLGGSAGPSPSGGWNWPASNAPSPRPSAAPTEEAAPWSAAARLQARRKQWEEQDEQLRRERDARIREAARREQEERERRRRALKEEAAWKEAQQQREADSQRHSHAVGLLRAKASQLSEENRRLRVELESRATNRSLAHQGSAMPAALHHAPVTGAWPARPDASPSATSPLNGSRSGTWHPWGPDDAGPQTNGSRRWSPGAYGDTVSSPDRSDVNVHINLYDSPTEAVTVSGSHPIRDAAGTARRSMTFSLASPEREFRLTSSHDRTERPQSGREQILAAKSEVEQAAKELTRRRKKGSKGQGRSSVG